MCHDIKCESFFEGFKILNFDIFGVFRKNEYGELVNVFLVS